MIFRQGLMLLAVAALINVATNQEQNIEFLKLLARSRGTSCYDEVKELASPIIKKYEQKEKACKQKFNDVALAVEADGKEKCNEFFFKTEQRRALLRKCRKMEDTKEKLRCLSNSSHNGWETMFGIYINSSATIHDSNISMKNAEGNKMNCTRKHNEELEIELQPARDKLLSCIESYY